MIIGAILQATSFSYAQLVVARIVTGLGNGLNVCNRSYMLLSLCFSILLTRYGGVFSDVDCALLPRRVLTSCETGQFHHVRGKLDYFWYNDLVS